MQEDPEEIPFLQPFLAACGPLRKHCLSQSILNIEKIKSQIKAKLVCIPLLPVSPIPKPAPLAALGSLDRGRASPESIMSRKTSSLSRSSPLDHLRNSPLKKESMRSESVVHDVPELIDNPDQGLTSARREMRFNSSDANGLAPGRASGNLYSSDGHELSPGHTCGNFHSSDANDLGHACGNFYSSDAHDLAPGRAFLLSDRNDICTFRADMNLFAADCDISGRSNMNPNASDGDHVNSAALSNHRHFSQNILREIEKDINNLLAGKYSVGDVKSLDELEQEINDLIDSVV